MQTKEELEKVLEEQLILLRVLADSYDRGDKIAAKSIATTIRVLLHDSQTSHSLLGQLNKKDGLFFDSSFSPKVPETGRMVVGSFYGLIGIFVGDKSSCYVPFLDDIPQKTPAHVKFNDYWKKVIFIDNKKKSFTREDIVLAVANQDGGAHVDPEIEESYKALARENSLGWKSNINNTSWEDLKGAELAAIRQIGHEILRTFLSESEYPLKKMNLSGANGFVMGGSPILVLDKPPVKDISPDKQVKVGRNEKCPCKSGLKFKKCCGK